jgi:hypothetical protein
MAELQERFAHDGGYGFHARVDKVLQGLGFDAEDAKTRALAGLSGGERGRLGLAAQLAAPADLVLLDEPTNHLDLETIQWLKEYLGEFGETVMVISHDRPSSTIPSTTYCTSPPGRPSPIAAVQRLRDPAGGAPVGPGPADRQAGQAHRESRRTTSGGTWRGG